MKTGGKEQKTLEEVIKEAILEHMDTQMRIIDDPNSNERCTMWAAVAKAVEEFFCCIKKGKWHCEM